MLIGIPWEQNLRLKNVRTPVTYLFMSQHISAFCSQYNEAVGSFRNIKYYFSLLSRNWALSRNIGCGLETRRISGALSVKSKKNNIKTGAGKKKTSI